jgi:hypothetical protein
MVIKMGLAHVVHAVRSGLSVVVFEQRRTSVLSFGMLAVIEPHAIPYGLLSITSRTANPANTVPRKYRDKTWNIFFGLVRV